VGLDVAKPLMDKLKHLATEDIVFNVYVAKPLMDKLKHRFGAKVGPLVRMAPTCSLE